MATPTYTLIEEQVLGSSASSVTFSSIPSTYKDLVLEFQFTGSGGAPQQSRLKFNSDSGSNYSATILEGNGSAASSGRSSNEVYIDIGYLGSASEILNGSLQIQSYANTSVYKSALCRNGYAASYLNAKACLWRSTAAISTITINAQTNSYATGSTFRLWGIA